MPTYRAPTRDDELQLDALRRVADILFRESSGFSIQAALVVRRMPRVADV